MKKDKSTSPPGRALKCPKVVKVPECPNDYDLSIGYLKMQNFHATAFYPHCKMKKKQNKINKIKEKRHKREKK